MKVYSRVWWVVGQVLYPAVQWRKGGGYRRGEGATPARTKSGGVVTLENEPKGCV